MNENASSEDARDGKYVTIRHILRPDVKTAFANHFVIQHTEAGEFQLSFFEIMTPLVLGDKEEFEAALKSIEAIDAVCVSRIAITLPRAEAIASALLENIEKFKAKHSSSASTESP